MRSDDFTLREVDLRELGISSSSENEVSHHRSQEIFREPVFKNPLDFKNSDSKALGAGEDLLLQTQAHRLVLKVLQSNEFLSRLKRQLEKIDAKSDDTDAFRLLKEEVVTQIESDREWGAFDQCFELLNSGFPEKIRARFPSLTTTESKIAALLKIGLSSKQIATLLFIASRTVDVHRLHIRRKVNLPPYESLGKFLSTI